MILNSNKSSLFSFLNKIKSSRTSKTIINSQSTTTTTQFKTLANIMKQWVVDKKSTKKTPSGCIYLYLSRFLFVYLFELTRATARSISRIYTDNLTKYSYRKNHSQSSQRINLSEQSNHVQWRRTATDAATRSDTRHIY